LPGIPAIVVAIIVTMMTGQLNHENISGDRGPIPDRRIGGKHPRNDRFNVQLSHGRPDTLEVNSIVPRTHDWLPYPVTTRWIPDAFASIETGDARPLTRS
jgi:hypothetical protein